MRPIVALKINPLRFHKEHLPLLDTFLHDVIRSLARRHEWYSPLPLYFECNGLTITFHGPPSAAAPIRYLAAAVKRVQHLATSITGPPATAYARLRALTTTHIEFLLLPTTTPENILLSALRTEASPTTRKTWSEVHDDTILLHTFHPEVDNLVITASKKLRHVTRHLSTSVDDLDHALWLPDTIRPPLLHTILHPDQRTTPLRHVRECVFYALHVPPTSTHAIPSSNLSTINRHLIRLALMYYACCTQEQENTAPHPQETPNWNALYARSRCDSNNNSHAQETLTGYIGPHGSMSYLSSFLNQHGIHVSDCTSTRPMAGEHSQPNLHELSIGLRTAFAEEHSDNPILTTLQKAHNLIINNSYSSLAVTRHEIWTTFAKLRALRHVLVSPARNIPPTNHCPLSLACPPYSNPQPIIFFPLGVSVLSIIGHTINILPPERAATFHSIAATLADWLQSITSSTAFSSKDLENVVFHPRLVLPHPAHLTGLNQLISLFRQVIQELTHRPTTDANWFHHEGCTYWKSHAEILYKLPPTFVATRTTKNITVSVAPRGTTHHIQAEALASQQYDYNLLQRDDAHLPGYNLSHWKPNLLLHDWVTHNITMRTPLSSREMIKHISDVLCSAISTQSASTRMISDVRTQLPTLVLKLRNILPSANVYADSTTTARSITQLLGIRNPPPDMITAWTNLLRSCGSHPMRHLFETVHSFLYIHPSIPIQPSQSAWTPQRLAEVLSPTEPSPHTEPYNTTTTLAYVFSQIYGVKTTFDCINTNRALHDIALWNTDIRSRVTQHPRLTPLNAIIRYWSMTQQDPTPPHCGFVFLWLCRFLGLTDPLKVLDTIISGYITPVFHNLLKTAHHECDKSSYSILTHLAT